MSKRPVEILIEDMLDSIVKIESYVKGLEQESFEKDSKTVDAVARNLEIIGEVASRIPEDFRSKYSVIEWRKIAGLRNRIIHDYFGIDLNLIWQVIVSDVPRLKQELMKLKQQGL